MAAKAAIDFLVPPPRSAKPRKQGLTVANDKAKSLAQAHDIVETVDGIIDHMKIPDHVGVMWRYPARLLRAKNQIYAAAGIPTLPGGIPFEVAAIQGKVPQYMERVAALGFAGVEVSEDSIDLEPADRVNAIKCALAAGLAVFTELGKKLPDRPLDAAKAITMAKRDLEADARLVVVEKSDVALTIRRGVDTLHRLMPDVGPKHLIIEYGPGADRFETRSGSSASSGRRSISKTSTPKMPTSSKRCVWAEPDRRLLLFPRLARQKTAGHRRTRCRGAETAARPRHPIAALTGGPHGSGAVDFYLDAKPAVVTQFLRKEKR